MRGILGWGVGWSLAALAFAAGAAGAAGAPTRPPFANFAELPQPHGGKLVLGPEGRSLYVNAGDRLLTYARDPHSTRLDLISDSESSGTTVLSPDGRFAYTATPPYRSDRARLEVLSRDPATGLLTHQQTVESGSPIAAMAMAPDGRDLYAVPPETEDPKVIRIRRDPVSGAVARVGDVSLDQRVSRGLAIKITPDGRELFVAGLNYGAWLRRDPATGVVEPLQESEYKYAPGMSGSYWQYDIAVSADGRRLYTGAGEFRALARDPGSGALTGLSVERAPCERASPWACQNGIVQPSPDGQLVAAVASDEFRMSLFETSSEGARQLRDWSWAGDGGLRSMLSTSAVEWAPDSRMLYVLGEHLGVWVREGDSRSLRFAGEAPLATRSDSPTPPGVVIVRKPKYVKSSRVSLKVGHPSGASSVRVANDPAMRGVRARRFAAGRPVSWRLRPGKRGWATVYARYMTRPGAKAAVRKMQKYSVVVDGAAPRVERVELIPTRIGRRAVSRLRIRARDARAGVRYVQVTTRRSRPGKARRYKRSLVVRGHPRTVWVRVIDKAGNRSHWKPCAAAEPAARGARTPSD